MLPSELKIGGILYTVALIDPTDDTGVDGHVNYEQQKIQVKANMAYDYTNQVFLHEVFHAIFEHCGLDQDESVVDRLAHCLYQVLKDNKLTFQKEV